MKTIGIVGSRRRDSLEDLETTRRIFLCIYEPGDTLVSGGCKLGGDRFAEIFRDEYSIPMVIHYPDKTKLKGNERRDYAEINFARNTLIARDCDVLIACVAKDRTGGTEDTILKTKRMKKVVVLVPQCDELTF